MRVNSISSKFYSILGLCQKAGKLITGEELCEKYIRTGNAQLVIVSDEASQNTKENFVNLCRYYKTDLLIYGSKEQLGHAIGKGSRTVIVILDKSFKQMIVSEINANEISMGVINDGEN